MSWGEELNKKFWWIIVTVFATGVTIGSGVLKPRLIDSTVLSEAPKSVEVIKNCQIIGFNDYQRNHDHRGVQITQ